MQASMAQPDRPNFTILGRIVFGIIAIAMIYLMLGFLGFVPARVAGGIRLSRIRKYLGPNCLYNHTRST